MKKKFGALLLALVVCITGMNAVDMTTNAQGIGENVSYESILKEDALIGNMQVQTWGVYLSSGTSAINDAGGGKIGAGGTTNARVECKVSITVVVERKVNGSWVRYTSWTASNSNDLVVTTGKLLSVPSGYYYRVRCTHYAATDTSSSYTGALWM